MSTMNPRSFLVLGLMLLFPAAILIQVLRIQVFEGRALRALWGEQAIGYIPIPAERGLILDASDRILVSNTVSYTVIVDPMAPRTSRADLSKIATTLARFTNKSAEDYERKIRSAAKGSRYVLLERGVSRAGHDALRELDIRGLILEEHFRRRYNYESMAAHTLGYVNHEVVGMMGIESSYNGMLKGQDGEQQVQRDSRGRIRAVVGTPRRRPVAGHSIRTTIDARIQAIVEEELRQGVIRARANHGTVIVVDPETGAIKAMANYPTYNPNSPAASSDENRRDFAIADMIEPGSTFKLITAVAATEQGVIREGEVFHTPANGQKRIFGQMMRDHDPLGSMDFRNVIQKSSNIATAEIAMRLDKQTYYQYARNFGFGTPSGIDLPGEESGRLQRPHGWSQVTLPWMSIGYEVQVTPLQMAMAYAAFANEGRLMRPYVVDEVIDERGNIIRKTKPYVVRTPIKPSTIETLYPIFESVLTEQGTAEFARVEGVAIAGKTGTAQKFVDGRYQTRYRATFVGFYPTDDPKYVCLVLMDEPRTSIYGGVVSGPVFKNITQRILALDGRLHRETVIPEDSITYVVPKVEGLSRNDAFALLDQMKFRYDREGRGTRVASQRPAAGTVIRKRQEIILVMDGGGK
jgi:cell division protein FtsI/penicillin-binding protein 2